jgi:hypothetical protein
MRLLALALLMGCCAERPPQLPAPRATFDRCIYVVGQVERPGCYAVYQPILLTQIVAIAKPTPIAWLSPTITRKTWTGQPIKVRVSIPVILEGRERDVWLYPGDVVHIGERTF